MARNKITFPICMDTAFGVPFTPISYIESYCSVGWRCHDNSSPTLFFPLIRFVTKPTLTARLHLKNDTALKNTAKTITYLRDMAIIGQCP